MQLHEEEFILHNLLGLYMLHSLIILLLFVRSLVLLQYAMDLFDFHHMYLDLILEKYTSEVNLNYLSLLNIKIVPHYMINALYYLVIIFHEEFLLHDKSQILHHPELNYCNLNSSMYTSLCMIVWIDLHLHCSPFILAF